MLCYGFYLKTSRSFKKNILEHVNVLNLQEPAKLSQEFTSLIGLPGLTKKAPRSIERPQPLIFPTKLLLRSFTVGPLTDLWMSLQVRDNLRYMKKCVVIVAELCMQQAHNRVFLLTENFLKLNGR